MKRLNRIAGTVADTLEKRRADLEYLLAHIPEDPNTRFAGVDVKPAELRELILLQNSRFTKLEARSNEQVAKLEARLTELSRKVDGQAGQLEGLSRKVDVNASKLDEILARLPKP